MFTIVCELTLPQAVTCGLPRKKREIPRNANQNKTTKRAGYKEGVLKRKEKRKHSELKEPYETLDKIKTLTTTARQKKAKEKSLK